MKRILTVLALFGTALGANAALMLREEKDIAELSGTTQVSLGGVRLAVPRAIIRDRAQIVGGRLERLDLAVAIKDFTPVPQPSLRDPNRPLPDRLTLVLSASANAPDSATMFQTIYARFLTPETTPHPGGLAMRRFRPGTPYEDRELYIGAGGRQPFLALCPRETHLREIEPCTTLVRRDGIDAELRFNARHLAEWRRIAAEATGLLAGLMPQATSR